MKAVAGSQIIIAEQGRTPQNMPKEETKKRLKTKKGLEISL
jgi:hypothetical protein